MLRILKPVEKIRLDNGKLEQLYSTMGAVAAEDMISRAMEELAVRLAKIKKCYAARQMDELQSVARSIATIGDQVGMSMLSSVAQDVHTLAQKNDGTALAATTARLARLGENTLMTIWDIQDLSV
jgi:hypothetical protein